MLRVLFIVSIQLCFLYSYTAEALKILTYNICWECMENANYGSAKDLGQKCHWEKSDGGPKVTTCATNMAQAIDEANEYYKNLSQSTEFDFVALQEASHWQDLKHITKSLASLTPHDVKWGKYPPFVTLYNSKYHLEKAISGGFEPTDRPFLILIFKEPIIFVNLHAGHNYKRELYERKLSDALANSGVDIATLKNKRMIVAGDFNDHGNQFWKAQEKNDPFVPFRSAGLMTPVYLQSEPEKTCCSTHVPFRRGSTPFTSDYILDSVKQSDKEKFRLKVPTRYDVAKPKSDHLPVIYETADKIPL